MRTAKVQASLRMRAVSPEPLLLTHTSSESRGTYRQKARSLAPLNGWACAVKTCHDGMLEDTNSLDGAYFICQSLETCKKFETLMQTWSKKQTRVYLLYWPIHNSKAWSNNHWTLSIESRRMLRYRWCSNVRRQRDTEFLNTWQSYNVSPKVEWEM